VFGADSVAFVNQGEQFKLFDNYETVPSFNLVSDPQFEAFGDKVLGFLQQPAVRRESRHTAES